MTHKCLRCGDDTRERERDTQQILEIDRKGGAAADLITAIIIYYLLCRPHATPLRNE